MNAAELAGPVLVTRADGTTEARPPYTAAELRKLLTATSGPKSRAGRQLREARACDQCGGRVPEGPSGTRRYCGRVCRLDAQAERERCRELSEDRTAELENAA